MLTMEKIDRNIKVGMIAALSAVKKTLLMYQDGMTSEEINDMISEIDQQLGLKEAEIQLLKRA